MIKQQGTGADPEISEKGGRKPNSRRGGRNLTFQCRFPSFSYKSLTNIPPKRRGRGGGRGPTGPSPKSAPEVTPAICNYTISLDSTYFCYLSYTTQSCFNFLLFLQNTLLRSYYRKGKSRISYTFGSRIVRVNE